MTEVILVGVAIPLLAITMAAQRNEWVGTTIVAGVAYVGVAFLSALLIVFGGLECDESCGQGPGWHHEVGAWQWQVMRVGGWTAVAAGAAALVALGCGRRRLAVAGGLVTVAALGAGLGIGLTG